MDRLKEFEIYFYGLKEGLHRFEYKIDKAFFEHYGYDEFLEADFDVDLEFLKKSTLLECHFKGQGKARVNCDLSNEEFDMPLNGQLDLVVKFGEEFNDDNEEVLVLPHGEHHLNVGQYIYEMMVLALPSKRIHPGIEDGTLDSDIVKRLEELSPDKENKKEDTDPRWDELKKLLIDKK